MTSTIDKQIALLPEEVKFCKKCVVSNQRPRIVFDSDGICGGCINKKNKLNINWDEREKEFAELCDQNRSSKGEYDVIVPSSGGKDSAIVSHVLKYKYNMHPLTITWAPFKYTKIGYENFRNYIKIGGFNNLMAWQNGRLHRKLSRLCLEYIGDAWQPFTYGQTAYAFHIASRFNVKLVMFGENGEAEYSGDPRVFSLKGMPFEEWKEQFFKGAGIEDIIKIGLEKTDYFSNKDFDESDLTFYKPPEANLMKDKGIIFRWYAYYKQWTPQENYYYAVENTGFEANPDGRSEGTYSKYASLDDMFDGFHFYLAFIKFGIGRTTSDAAHEIRDGHIDRDEGISLVKRFDGEFPNKNFKEFLEYLDIDSNEFWRIVDKYRSEKIWHKDGNLWKLNNPIYKDTLKDDEVPGYISSLPESYFEYNK